jgi:hypothetical protein
MSIASAQRLANFPSMLPAAPGAFDVQTAGPQSAAMLASGGTFTLNGATPVAVVNARVTANSIIIITLKTAAGTVSPTAPNVLTITPGTGFTVGGVAADTSDYNYCVLG